MEYLLLIHHSEVELTPGDDQKLHADYDAYTKEIAASGVMRGGNALMPSTKASKVTVREGKQRVVDGPFTEAKEVCGGYYLVDVPNKEEALKWAAKCPGARHGTMEVREVMVYPKA